MKYIKLCLILLCLFAPFYIGVDTVYADNSDYVTSDKDDYFFQFREPVVDDNSMYIVFLLEDLSTGARTVHLQYIATYPRYTTSSDEYVWADDVFYQLDILSTGVTVRFNVSSTTMARAYSYKIGRNWGIVNYCNDTFTTQYTLNINYTNYGYKILGYDIIGSNYILETGIAGKETFTYLFSDESTQYNTLLDIIQEIALNNELSSDQLELLGSILDELQSNGVTIDSLLTIMKDLELNTDQLDYYLDLIYKNVNNIYNKTDEVEYYLDLIYKQLNSIYNNTDDVEELLQELIDLFTPTEGEEDKYPSPDTGSQIELEMKGNQLTNTDTTNHQQDLNIEVNNNAGGYIWTLFNNFISSNAKVIGMYITLLSCAFIALILGR